MSRVRITIVLVVALALVVPALPAGAGAFPGANGKIAFVAGDDVFTVEPDGMHVTKLAQAEGLDAENVAASPDGKRIAFNVGSTTSAHEAGLYVINMNGSGIRDVLATRHDDFIAVGAPTWSPDGSRIAFEGYSYPALENELFVIDTDGTHLRKLTNCDCVGASHPVWSPAGPEIAFVPCCGRVVMTINADTGVTTEVFSPEGGSASHLTWSPDGTQIAYEDSLEVYRVAIPNGTPVALTATGGGYYREPSWSPDGTQILVASNHATQQGSNNQDLYAIDAVDGLAGGVARVTSALDSESQADWAPLCESQCTPTSLSFRVAKKRSKLRVVGTIAPPPTGAVKVALFRKTASGFKRLGAKRPGFGVEGRFAASFDRPSSGRCKVQVRYAGDADHEPALARRSFAC